MSLRRARLGEHPLLAAPGTPGTARPYVGQGAQIGAPAGVISDVSAGAVLLGSPAQPRMEFFRQVAALKRMVKKPE